MTTKTYSAQPPIRNKRIIRPVPMPRPLQPASPSQSQLFADLRRFSETLQLHAGTWYCSDCEAGTEREEGEQGQPAHCAKCGSPRIEWIAPMPDEPQDMEVVS